MTHIVYKLPEKNKKVQVKGDYAVILSVRGTSLEVHLLNCPQDETCDLLSTAIQMIQTPIEGQLLN